MLLLLANRTARSNHPQESRHPLPPCLQVSSKSPPETVVGAGDVGVIDAAVVVVLFSESMLRLEDIGCAANSLRVFSFRLSVNSYFRQNSSVREGRVGCQREKDLSTPPFHRTRKMPENHA